MRKMDIIEFAKLGGNAKWKGKTLKERQEIMAKVRAKKPVTEKKKLSTECACTILET